MRMCELSLSERDMLDRLNNINQKYEKDETQSLWNVCWGYLHDKFSWKMSSSNFLNIFHNTYYGKVHCLKLSSLLFYQISIYIIKINTVF